MERSDLNGRGGRESEEDSRQEPQAPHTNITWERTKSEAKHGQSEASPQAVELESAKSPRRWAILLSVSESLHIKGVVCCNSL